MADQTTVAGWYPDPYGRHELRYWDGALWTEHVSSHGNQKVDAVPAAPVIPTVRTSAEKIQAQAASVGVTPSAGAPVAGSTTPGSLFSEQVLVVNQKMKLIELNNEYAVFDQHGTQIAAVRQVGQSVAKKALRLLSSLDQFMTHKLQVCDMTGNVLLAITRPAKVMRSTVIVSDGAGGELGKVVQDNVFGKIHFSFEAYGQKIGSINAENWRAWNFNIQDANGIEVARITKTWEGLAKTMFTTADNYVLQIYQPLDEPLRSLVVASALTVDTALKQDSRGFG